MRPGACILTSPSEGAGASSHHCLGVGGSGFTLLVTTHLQLRSAKGYHARTLALPQPRPGNILRNGAAGGGGGEGGGGQRFFLKLSLAGKVMSFGGMGQEPL